MLGQRCARVGCGRLAAARFGFDSRNCLVWLDTLDGAGLGAGLLCATHADRLTPPRGWHLQDLRAPAPRLWSERPPVPNRATAMPMVPVAGGRDTALEQALDARTPLLARAFDAAREPRPRN